MRILIFSLATLFACLSGANAAPDGCTVVSEYCADEGGTRTFFGLPIERDCWEERIFYSCPGGPCSELSDDPECTQTGTVCVLRDESEICLDEDKTFRCSAIKNGDGIILTETVEITPAHDVISPVICGESLYCPEGVCDDLGQDEASTDFSRAASWMGLLSKMGEETDPDTLTLFHGEGHKCAKWPLSAKDCCSEDGWLLSTFGCSTDEMILAEKRAVRTTHYVGEYCSQETLSVCITRKKSYCAFRSKFARVLQEQGRAQLGIGWGDAESPSCRPLSIEEFKQIDFAAIDLSEIYAAVAADAIPPDPDAVNQMIQERIEQYYGDIPP